MYKHFTCLFYFLTVFSNAQTLKKTQHLAFIFDKGYEICGKKSANENFCKSLEFFKEKKYDSCYVFSEIALLEVTTQEEKDILNYIQGINASKKGLDKKAISSILKIQDTLFNSLKFYQLGRINLKLDEYDKAIDFFLKSKKNTRNHYNIQKRKIYHNLGVCYTHKKDYKTAEKYFNKEAGFLNKNDTLSLINFKTSLANIYYNKYLDDKAIPLFKEAYDLARKKPNLELKHTTSRNMAVVEKNRKRYKESIKYYEEYTNWKDSIWNRDKIWELTEKDKQLAVAQKQQEIAVQDEQIKRQKVVQNGLLLGASGLLVFIGGLGYFYRRLKKQKQLITQQKEALDVANKTKNYLFSVVSHDLRSPINTIKRQHKKLAKHIANNDLPAIKEANQQAISVTDSTSHLLNNVLQWSLEQSNQLNFSQEDYALQPIIEHILFDYEDLAESHNIAISTNFENDIVVKTDKESLKIVLRNLIDNSIKYMNGAGSIAISTATQKNQARIEIKDSGIGISEEKLQKINALKDLSVDKIDRSKGVGLGLILCQTLIKKNNGTLFFESEEGKSTTAILLLPLG